MINKKIQEGFKIKGHLRATIRDAKTGEIKRVYEYKNLNPTTLFTMIANNLTEPDPDNAMVINYGAVGTGTNVPALANTTLQTELERTFVASLSNVGPIAYITAFFNETQGNGVLREAGLFSNGTSSANTGVLVSRVNINITKSVTESLTLDWTITIG
jgi:hypothetical protein